MPMGISLLVMVYLLETILNIYIQETHEWELSMM
ncbi:hypothetical protein SDC9_206847 [bioreactor metagenome]|uniref:Uncharacterized protein n=1 Tax=bioreactor metagenome TaxID=1076179 RepID=A0A645J652_9ZZZZ